MHLLKIALIATLALALSACQSLFQADPTAQISATRSAWEHTQTGCQGDECPLVNIDTLSFAAEPALDSLIEHELLEMTGDTPEAAPPASLQAYEQAFLQSAQPGWNSYLQAKVREQHDGLVIIELSSYLSTGGAHGMPGRRFINYDRKLHKALTLQDMLLPGQEQAFWQAARLAHQGWLAASQLDQDPEFVKNWPFQPTENVALTFGAVTLKYEVYGIGPYASGHPELKIPYPRLNGILKPQYFPGRG